MAKKQFQVSFRVTIEPDAEEDNSDEAIIADLKEDLPNMVGFDVDQIEIRRFPDLRVAKPE